MILVRLSSFHARFELEERSQRASRVPTPGDGDHLNKKWRTNADEIAELLHAANTKHWRAATVRTAMYTHLDQTLAEATHRVKGDYAGDVKDYDAIEKHILVMADILSDGIIAQFPEKFARK